METIMSVDPKWNLHGWKLNIIYIVLVNVLTNTQKFPSLVLL